MCGVPELTFQVFSSVSTLFTKVEPRACHLGCSSQLVCSGDPLSPSFPNASRPPCPSLSIYKNSGNLSPYSHIYELALNLLSHLSIPEVLFIKYQIYWWNISLEIRYLKTFASTITIIIKRCFWQKYILISLYDSLSPLESFCWHIPWLRSANSSVLCTKGIFTYFSYFCELWMFYIL